MGDLFLLLGKRSLLNGKLLSTQIFKGAVVAAVAHKFAMIYMQRDIGHGV